MIATGLLVTSLAILLETQSTAAYATFEADRIITATWLAQDKLSEVRMLVEHEGFPDSDVNEEGDFRDFGSESFNLELRELREYKWEYLIAEIDLGLAGDLTTMAQNLSSQFGMGGAEGGGGMGAAMPDLGSLGIPVSNDMITEMLSPYIREVRVRVWWGDNLKKAEEQGDEVIIVSHVINPHGNMLATGGMGGGAPGMVPGAGGAPGQQGGAPGMGPGMGPRGGQMAPGGAPGGPGRGGTQPMQRPR